MGATGGLEPSEEERINVVEERKKIEPNELKIPKRFAEMFSTNSDSITKDDSDTYKEALGDILRPPSAPDRVEQIVREGFL